MKQSEIHKLATELWVRDNPKIVERMQVINPTKEELKETGHWYIAISKLALRIMREKRRKAKWEQY